MNILNDIEFLQKDQFSFFKIKTQGDDIPTGFRAFNLPQGMNLVPTDGWVYGTPSQEETVKTIFIAQGNQENTYKFVDIVVKDFTFFKEFKDKLRELGNPEDIDISEIKNFDQKKYFKNLKINNLLNTLPLNITGFRYPLNSGVNINLDLLLSGFYKNTGYSGYGGWWTDNCKNPPWCDEITTGLNQFDFINSSTSTNFIFSVIDKFGKTKITGWGDNTNGNAIDGNRVTGAILISAGHNHSLALLDTFKITGWGNNTHNQALGGINLTGVAGISAGSGYSLALLFNKKVTGWGLNNYGQVSGDILGGDWSINPVAILTGVRQVSAGGTHSLALLSNRTITGWGDNTYNQALGGRNLTGVIQISAGYEHSLALLNNHKVTGWGRNNYGQVSGLGSFTSWENSPISKLNKIVKIEAGGYHSLALLSNGLVTGWGLNNFGQASSFCVKTFTGNCNPIVPTCIPGSTYPQITSFDSQDCPVYTCIPCQSSINCGAPPFPPPTIIGYNNITNCPIYQCLCNQGFSCNADNQNIFGFYEREEGLGTINITFKPTFRGWIPNTTQILWGDLMPLTEALTEKIPTNYLNTLEPWVVSHTYLSETPTTIETENILIDYDANSCPVFLCRAKVTLVEPRGVNLRNVLNIDPNSLQGVELTFKIEGNAGALPVPSSAPAISTGPWPAGTILKIENGPLIGGGCNPVAGVIAGRGDGFCGPGIKGTAAIHVEQGIHLVILNNGKIGGGGGNGGDLGGACGEGGPGAGIPAGQNNGGGGNNTCCGGEGAASVLCGGNGGGGSGPGGNLGNRGGCGSFCPNNANPAIRLAAGASFAFDSSSSNPFFEGEGGSGPVEEPEAPPTESTGELPSCVYDLPAGVLLYNYWNQQAQFYANILDGGYLPTPIPSPLVLNNSAVNLIISNGRTIWETAVCSGNPPSNAYDIVHGGADDYTIQQFYQSAVLGLPMRTE